MLWIIVERLVKLLFLASKFIGATDQGVVQHLIVPAVVREGGNKAFCNLLPPIYTVMQTIQDTLNSWIAVPKQSCDFVSYILSTSSRV